MKSEKKAVVITGATSGIGLAAARNLAASNFFVVGVGRSEEKCRIAKTLIQTESPNSAVEYLTADLSVQRNIRELAASIENLTASRGCEGLAGLVNNAATVASWYTTTAEGYELQFAVNHLAPFLLTRLLLPLLQSAPEARIVTVSSGSHRSGRIHWDDLHLRKGYHLLKAYRQSKLANVIFTYELARRLGKHGSVRAFAADPGLVNTGLGQKNTLGFESWFWSKRRKHGVGSDHAAKTIVHLITAPIKTLGNGTYWLEGKPIRSGRVSYNRDAACRLWERSERMCGIQEKEIFAPLEKDSRRNVG